MSLPLSHTSPTLRSFGLASSIYLPILSCALSPPFLLCGFALYTYVVLHLLLLMITHISPLKQRVLLARTSTRAPRLTDSFRSTSYIRSNLVPAPVAPSPIRISSIIYMHINSTVSRIKPSSLLRCAIDVGLHYNSSLVLPPYYSYYWQCVISITYHSQPQHSFNLFRVNRLLVLFQEVTTSYYDKDTSRIEPELPSGQRARLAAPDSKLVTFSLYFPFSFLTKTRSPFDP